MIEVNTAMAASMLKKAGAWNIDYGRNSVTAYIDLTKTVSVTRRPTGFYNFAEVNAAAMKVFNSPDRLAKTYKEQYG